MLGKCNYWNNHRRVKVKLIIVKPHTVNVLIIIILKLKTLRPKHKLKPIAKHKLRPKLKAMYLIAK